MVVVRSLAAQIVFQPIFDRHLPVCCHMIVANDARKEIDFTSSDALCEDWPLFLNTGVSFGGAIKIAPCVA